MCPSGSRIVNGVQSADYSQYTLIRPFAVMSVSNSLRWLVITTLGTARP
jgi:hypothetical protein